MKITVVDLEMNQPSGSIIEVGAVCLDCKTGVIESTFESLVDPQEVLDDFIVELTGITQGALKGQPSLSTVLRDFWSWNGKRMVGGWGKDAHMVVELSRGYLNVVVPHHKGNIDLKALVQILQSALSANDQRNRRGLEGAMASFGLEFEGRQHRALTDAKNTARLVGHCVGLVSKCLEVQAVLGGEV